MTTDPYIRKAELLGVYDGDTVTLRVDVGYDIWTVQTFRLWGINTPELRGGEREAGKAARKRLLELIEGAALFVKSLKNTKERSRRGKYGRYLGVLFADGVNVNDKLVSEGHAVEYMR